MSISIYKISKNDSTVYADPRPAKEVLGGKGAGLLQMVEAGMNVPPAFTIPTDVCNALTSFTLGGKDYNEYVHALMAQVEQNVDWLTAKFGYRPLVSVRSGAAISMPGMMDTILNVGLNDTNMADWTQRIGLRPALDSYRRLIQMLGSTAYDIPMEVFDTKLNEIKAKAGVEADTDLTANDLSAAITAYKLAFQAAAQTEFPQDPKDQLEAAIWAVFNSWQNPRAIEYRKINKIDPNLGTACTVQAMVFGNMGDDSGSGVAFTRDPSTGANVPMAEYLPNAQGEDVVAGIRTPFALDLETLSLVGEDGTLTGLPVWGADLITTMGNLEDMYQDMVDLEFTVQQGELFILQSRTGKRSAQAAFKIATDLVAEGVITPATAAHRLSVAQYKLVRRPIIDPQNMVAASDTGLAGCPGVAVGRPVFSAQEAVDATDPVILVTEETNPDDIAGMNAAAGILTRTGGMTSHAAVVARAMDKPCVVGCTDLDIPALKLKVQSHPDLQITICGATGRVWMHTEVKVIDASDDPSLKIVEGWALELGGWSQQVVLEDQAVGTDRTVLGTEWYGSTDVLGAVLTGLQALDPEDRAKVTLDLRGPTQLGRDRDLELLEAFGDQPGMEEHQWLHTVAIPAILQQAAGLKGLNVMLLPDDSAATDLLRQAGIGVAGEPSTMADILSGSPIALSPDVVQTLFGSHAAMLATLHALTGAGHKINTLKPAVPVEYAVFTLLGR